MKKFTVISYNISDDITYADHVRAASAIAALNRISKNRSYAVAIVAISGWHSEKDLLTFYP